MSNVQLKQFSLPTQDPLPPLLNQLERQPLRFVALKDTSMNSSLFPQRCATRCQWRADNKRSSERDKAGTGRGDSGETMATASASETWPMLLLSLGCRSTPRLYRSCPHTLTHATISPTTRNTITKSKSKSKSRRKTKSKSKSKRSHHSPNPVPRCSSPRPSSTLRTVHHIN